VDIPIHFSAEDDAPLSEDDATEIYKPGRVALPQSVRANAPPPPPEDDWGATVVSKPPMRETPARRSPPPQPFNPEQTVKLEGHELDQLAPERTSPRRRR
jgi:hypothetical protein